MLESTIKYRGDRLTLPKFEQLKLSDALEVVSSTISGRSSYRYPMRHILDSFF